MDLTKSCRSKRSGSFSFFLQNLYLKNKKCDRKIEMIVVPKMHPELLIRRRQTVILVSNRHVRAPKTDMAWKLLYLKDRKSTQPKLKRRSV